MPSLPNTLDYEDGITCIDTEQVRPGLACCYLLRDGDEYAFVECGTSLSVPGLLAVLEARGIDRAAVKYVMPTHVHLDHAGGAGLLMRELPAARLVIHPRGARHMIDPAKLVEGATAVYGAANMAAMYGEIVPIAESRVIVADDGFALDLGDTRRLEFIDAPGHAKHHYAIWDAQSRGWFTGDTFGLSYRDFDGPDGPYLLPTTTPVQFDPQAWAHTLDRFMQRDPRWVYLTHYGRIGDLARRADDLRRGLRDYMAIARTTPKTAKRHAELQEALMQQSLDRLRELRSPVAEPLARELLRFDMDLNAQGLEVWLDRPAAA